MERKKTKGRKRRSRRKKCCKGRQYQRGSRGWGMVEQKRRKPDRNARMNAPRCRGWRALSFTKLRLSLNSLRVASSRIVASIVHGSRVNADGRWREPVHPFDEHRSNCVRGACHALWKWPILNNFALIIGDETNAWRKLENKITICTYGT